MIINDTTPNEVIFNPAYSRGAIPRDYSVQPYEMMANPDEIELIDENEWEARIREQEEQQSSLEHILRRKGIKPLDQNGFNYCWSHSLVHCHISLRAMFNLPFVQFSAVGLAAKLVNGKNDGAWCGLSAKGARELGVPLKADWPQDSRSMTHDKPKVWENAAKYKTVVDYYDLDKPVWGQELKFKQVASLLLRNIPCAVDFNWWGHSVMAARLIMIEKGSYGLRILNSWYDVPVTKPWGEEGFGTLQGNRAIPDGAVGVKLIAA